MERLAITDAGTTAIVDHLRITDNCNLGALAFANFFQRIPNCSSMADDVGIAGIPYCMVVVQS